MTRWNFNILLGCILVVGVAIISVRSIEKVAESREIDSAHGNAIVSANFEGNDGGEARNSDRKFIDNHATVMVSESLDSTPNIESTQRIARYLSERDHIVLLDSYIESRLSDADLPELYRMLDDESHAMDWRNVLFAICVLEDGDRALAVAEGFITRYWDWQHGQFSEQEAQSVIRGIVLSITVLGVVDQSLSGPFLRKVFTQGGSKLLLDDWLNNPLPGKSPFEQTLLHDAVFAAGGGLLHTRSPELFAVVEERFQQLATVPLDQLGDYESSVLGACISLMAERDVYLEMGWEEGVHYLFELPPESRLQVIMGRRSEYYRRVSEIRDANRA